MHIETPTDFIETNIFYTVAKALGWKVEVLIAHRNPMIELKKNNLVYRIWMGGISVNSNVSTKISKDKHLTSQMLKKVMPYATDARVFLIKDITNDTFDELSTAHPKLVVKPIDENNGLGITTAIENWSDFQSAIERVGKIGHTEVLIENHVEAISEYRVILWKGEPIDAILRLNANVVGDSQSTIESLINQKNAFRHEKFGTLFEDIVIDESLKAFIKTKGLTVDSIPPAGESVVVRDMCNLSQGGETKRVSVDSIHPEYTDMFKKVYESTWLNYCGVDLITPDIAQKPEVGKTVINEINAAPGITLACFADLAEDRPFYGAQQIINKMETDPIQSLNP
jgi:cyanophycin synthetase